MGGIGACGVLGVALQALALGAHLYSVHCSSCHGAALQGSVRAPALTRTDAAMVDFMLRTGRMPSQDVREQQMRKPPQLPGDQIDAIVAFVRSRSTGQAWVASPAPLPSPLPTSVLVAGREVYEENCEQCHAATGRGGAATAYHDIAPSIVDDDANVVMEAVREGPDVMPRFGAHVIDDRSLRDLTAYVHYLQTAHYDPGGEPLKNWGPVSEGLAAWVLGIGFLVLFVRRIGET